MLPLKETKFNWKYIENKVSIFATDIKNGIIKYKVKQILLSHDSSPPLDKKLICFYGNSKTAIREWSLLCVCVFSWACNLRSILLGIRKKLKWVACRIKWGKGKEWNKGNT